MRNKLKTFALTTVLISGGGVTAASAATGGASLGSTSTSKPTYPVASAPSKTSSGVTIPAGMKTIEGIKAKRYKGKNAQGRAAYFAKIPLGAPASIQKAIIAANKIVGKPYRLGGGHARLEDTAYDCSGTVSYALIGGGLMKTTMSSYDFYDETHGWGADGEGDWVTVYANSGHVYVVLAGLRLDTSAAGDKSGLKGPQWRGTLRDSSAFRARTITVN